MSIENNLNQYVYGNVLRLYYKCIDAYKEVKNPEERLNCSNCELKPLTWEFNNGESTACGCGESRYNHFSIYAESIMSYVKRNDRNALGYDHDALRKNWNHWVETKEELFLHAGLRNDGRW